MGGAISLTSSLLSLRLPSCCICLASSSLLSLLGRSTAIRISARAKVAMASSRKEKPSRRSGNPKVNLSTPTLRSMPMVEIMMPNSAMISALSTCPLPAKAATAERPSTMRAK